MTRRDYIEVDGLRLDCVVGIRPDERDREQTLTVDLRLGLDLAEAGRRARISATVDYSHVARQVTALLRFRRYGLIENAAEELAAMLFGVHDRLETIELRLAKPGALEGQATAAAVGIRRG